MQLCVAQEKIATQQATISLRDFRMKKKRPKKLPNATPLVGIIMGSESDWPTLEQAATTLKNLAVPYEAEVVSAHRTPDKLRQYALNAEMRGLKVIIAGAGGAAHLPGMCASWTTLPVLGVPVESRILHGVDSLLSIVQMPSGIPVGTLAIGTAGAVNAALFACAIMALNDEALSLRLKQYRAQLTERVLKIRLPQIKT